MGITKVKEAVSRKGIQKEIVRARKKLNAMQKKKNIAPAKQQAIYRQLVQLQACESILWDIFLTP